MPPAEPAELGLLQLLGRAQRLVDGGEDHVLQHLDVVGVDRVGVDRDRLDDEVAGDLTVTMPPPAEASTSSCLSCSWAAIHVLLHLLDLLEHLLHVGGCGIRADLPARRVADRRGRSPRRRTPS